MSCKPRSLITGTGSPPTLLVGAPSLGLPYASPFDRGLGSRVPPIQQGKPPLMEGLFPRESRSSRSAPLLKRRGSPFRPLCAARDWPVSGTGSIRIVLLRLLASTSPSRGQRAWRLSRWWSSCSILRLALSFFLGGRTMGCEAPRRGRGALTCERPGSARGERGEEGIFGVLLLAELGA